MHDAGPSVSERQGAEHLGPDALAAGLPAILEAPTDDGTLRLVVRRPAVDERDVLITGMLDVAEGLVGDTWSQRPSRRSLDGGPHPDMQLNVMSARVIDLLAGDPERWPLAGDQLYVDLDLSAENLPPGTVLALGDRGASIMVTDQPHTGCAKFSARFGVEALRFVNAPAHANLHLRGINARVHTPGEIRPGDLVRKLPG